MGVELLSDLCAVVNPAFDSEIFFTVRHVFLLGAADDGGPEALVISTSDSLPTEESEENTTSSSAGWRSSAGAAASLPVCLSGRGAGDQYSITLAFRRSELCHNQRVQSEKQSKNRGNNSEDSRRLMASIGRFRQRAFG